ncbi:Sugar transporter ERD6-like 7 [Linum grandiflorum]
MSIKEAVENNMREPLVGKNDYTDVEDGSSENKSGSLWMVYFSTFVAICGAYEFGCCVGFSSPTQDAIRRDLSLSLAEYSVFGSILTFGAMIGAATSGPLADLLGRKGAMRLSSAFCAAGWLAIYFAKGAVALDIGRLATGFGMGVFSYVVPVFISEIAPKNLRGALATLNQVMICGGASASFILGTFLTWRVLALTGLVPCAVLLIGLMFMPESPRWLAKTGNEKDFVLALQKLRGKDADISEEADEIKEYIELLDRLPQVKLLDLFNRRYLKSVIIGVGLMVVQQFGGINGVCFYVSNIFKSAGFSPSVGTIIYAIIQIVVTLAITQVIDRAGRKPLLLVSGSGLVLACLIIGLSFYLKVNELALHIVPMLAVTGLLLYVGSFSAGMGAVPWVIMSEIFPINIKGTAGGMATLVNWFGAWAVSYTYNFLMSWSSYGTFLLYAAVNALSIVFVIKLVPETKGRTLEQIQAAING